jgi:predicted XRE-type DNA-binding protein
MRSGTSRNKKKQEMSNPALEVEASSGNVFADLELPRPQEALAKAELAQRITAIIAERKLTQARAAALLGVDQPKVSALLRGKLGGSSTERLIRFLKALGSDVEFVIRPQKQSGVPAGVRVQSDGGE